MSDKTSDSITMTDCTFTSTAPADVRNAALEEAALRMEQLGADFASRNIHASKGCNLGAAAIRALKEGKAE